MKTELVPATQHISHDWKLLENLIAVHSPSGEEYRMKEFLRDYVTSQSKSWHSTPEIIDNHDFQDALMLVFGTPRTVIYAHTDTIGFTARYENQLLPIGSPFVENDLDLIGEDGLGPIRCQLKLNDDEGLTHDFPRGIIRGTSLVFEPNFRLTKNFIQSPYLDNRLGVYAALKVAETLKDGVIVFSTYEEHGGGSVSFLTRYLYDRFRIKQALIADITWVTEGVVHGEGVTISLRDRNIPRRKFTEMITKMADQSGIPYQLEVEGSGSSDGREVQMAPYPIDWCFIGAPEDHVHSPDEKVHIGDLDAMIKMYRYLMYQL